MLIAFEVLLLSALVNITGLTIFKFYRLHPTHSHVFFLSVLRPGVRGADESELMRIVSEPREEHLLLGPDYSLLEAVLPKLSRRVCFTASEPPLPVKKSQPSESIHTQHQSKVLCNKLRFPWKNALILTAVAFLYRWSQFQTRTWKVQ